MAPRRAAVLVLMAVGLGACGGGGGGKSSSGGETDGGGTAAGPGTEVTAKEFSFSPAHLTLKAGAPARIVLKNVGSIEHDLTVSDADFKVTASGGKTKAKELTVAKPGTYEFHCSVAGHRNAGMKGELTVE